MNLGNIAGLVSAPLKTKGWNFVKNVTTFNRNGVGTNIIPGISLANNTPTIFGGAPQYSPFIEWVGSGTQGNTAGGYPPGSYPLKIQAGATPNNFSNSIEGGFIIRGQQTLSQTSTWNTMLYLTPIGVGGFIKLTGDWGFYGSYPNAVCWGISPYNTVFSIGTNGRTFLGANANLGWTSAAATTIDTLGDAVFSRSGAADIRQGYANAAAPVSQTFSVQNVLSGTYNTAGATRFINGSVGTGTGAGGAITFRVAPASVAGNTPNTLTNVLTISSTAIRATQPLNLENGTTANSMFVYNTYTDVSNFERGFLKWNTNVFQLGTDELGTGLGRSLDIQTDGTTRMSVAAAGNVGINTSTPNERLTVVGNISAAGDISVATSLQGIILVAPDSTRWRITVTNTGSLSTTAL